MNYNYYINKKKKIRITYQLKTKLIKLTKLSKLIKLINYRIDIKIKFNLILKKKH